MIWSGLSTILMFIFVSMKGCSGELKARCTGVNVCLQYATDQRAKTSVYWFDKSSGVCSLLGEQCVQPNLNHTFKTLKDCNEACKGEIKTTGKATKCGENPTGKECDEDLPPTSNSNTTSRPFSTALAIGCAIGGIALVAIVVASAYVIKRRKKQQTRHYVQDMLNMWSSNSDDSYDSYSDNPEDNNLFDRLERNW